MLDPPIPGQQFSTKGHTLINGQESRSIHRGTAEKENIQDAGPKSDLHDTDQYSPMISNVLSYKEINIQKR